MVPHEQRQSQITLWLDDDTIAWFRRQVNDADGGNYLALINAALRDHIQQRQATNLEETLRKVIREELRAVG